MDDSSYILILEHQLRICEKKMRDMAKENERGVEQTYCLRKQLDKKIEENASFEKVQNISILLSVPSIHRVI